MTTFSEVAAATDDTDGVYTLHLTHSEALAVWRALDDWGGHTEHSIRAMYRLAARLEPNVPAGRP